MQNEKQLKILLNVECLKIEFVNFKFCYIEGMINCNINCQIKQNIILSVENWIFLVLNCLL